MTIKKSKQKYTHTHIFIFGYCIERMSGLLGGCGRVLMCVGASHQAIVIYNCLMKCFDAHRSTTAIVW